MNTRRILLCVVLALCLLPGAAFARAKVALPDASPLTATCLAEAAKANDLPLAALMGILAAENGRPGEALRNKNGTWDMGPFQVNSCHAKDLTARGIDPKAVLRDGCVNAHAAAWLLRRELDRTGDLWRAIGSYHSRTPHRRDAYIAKVKKHLARLSRAGISTLPLLASDSVFEKNVYERLLKEGK